MPIHKLFKRGDEVLFYDYPIAYLCNQAVKVTKSKASWQWKNVTCKNCLKRRY